ncbi:MAG: PorT family protein [Cyclobacteriaceae bacterium]|nr:PorT family protein [Cyclobacteriaceae bacterium]
MKKGVITVLFVLVGLSAFSQAQVAIGIKGGLNFANIDASSLNAAYNSRTGYHAGAFVLVKLGKIGIQPELIYSKQGSTVRINSVDIESNYDYFNIPIVLKLYTVAGINIQLGPQFGFASGNIPYTSVTGQGQTVTLYDKLKGSDISAALGLGWDAPFGLTFDARYNLGLTKINEGLLAKDVKNQVIQISVGYKLFKFGK